MGLFTLDSSQIVRLTQFGALCRHTWILAVDFSVTEASSGQLLAPLSSQGQALKAQSLLSSRGHFLDLNSGSVWASNTQRRGAKLHLILPLRLQDFPSSAPHTLTSHQPPPWWPCLFVHSSFSTRLHYPVCAQKSDTQTGLPSLLPMHPILKRVGWASFCSFCRAPVYIDCWVGFHEPGFTLNF